MESSEKMKIARKQLERNEKRISELKRLFIKIYKDNAKGKLSDERFDMMSQTYEAEQKQLEAEVITLRKDLEVQQRQNENIEQFIQKAHKYVGIEELDPYALRELVKAIYVDAPVKINGKRTQHIHIQYDGIGFIPLDELLKEETACPKPRRPLKTNGFQIVEFNCLMNTPLTPAGFLYQRGYNQEINFAVCPKPLFSKNPVSD